MRRSRAIQLDGEMQMALCHQLLWLICGGTEDLAAWLAAYTRLQMSILSQYGLYGIGGPAGPR